MISRYFDIFRHRSPSSSRFAFLGRVPGLGSWDSLTKQVCLQVGLPVGGTSPSSMAPFETLLRNQGEAQ